MGLIELIESEPEWKIIVSYDAESGQWIAILRKYEMGGPVKSVTADNMLGAITELDWQVRQAHKEQEA